MIFCAKNEDGVSTYDLTLRGIKDITRRPKPLEVGKTYAIQPGRGKKSGGRFRCIDVMSHNEWVETFIVGKSIGVANDRMKFEARREGFLTWMGLIYYFRDHGKDINDMFRNVFELVDICPGCEHKRVGELARMLGESPYTTECTEPEPDVEFSYKLGDDLWSGIIGVKSCSEFRLKESMERVPQGKPI